MDILTTSRGSLVAFAAAMLFVAEVDYAQAGIISVQNAGFETDRVGGDGSWSTTAPTGWDVVGDLNASDNYFGVWNPVANGYPTEGRKVAYLDIATSGPLGYLGFEQVLSTTAVLANYVLEVDVGNTDWGSNSYVGFPGYRVEFLLDDVVVASDSTQNPAEGKFSTSTVSYTAQIGDEGKKLSLRLLNTNASGLGREVDFDNVRLNTTNIPEPATVLLVALGLIGLAGSRRRRKVCRV
jgi:hypothetical protein